MTRRSGTPGDVTVTGGAWDDSLGSGADDETLTGGAGWDSYQFRWFPGDNLGHDTILDFQVGRDSPAGNCADCGTGGHILDVVRTETGTGTRFQAHDAGTLVHTLDAVGVLGLPDGMLHQPMGIFGPIARSPPRSSPGMPHPTPPGGGGRWLRRDLPSFPWTPALCSIRAGGGIEL